MKITDNPIPSAVQKVEGPKPQGGQSGVFKKMVDDAMKETDTTAKAEKGPPPPFFFGVSIVGGTVPVKHSSLEAHLPVVEELEEALELVDFYADKLGDESVSASSLEGLIGHLKDRLSGLKLLEQAELPSGLKRLASDLTMAIGKEVIKFDRGDYS